MAAEPFRAREAVVLKIDLAGKVVLITGAAGGIGAMTARRIAEGGGFVILHEKKRTPGLTRLKRELNDAGDLVVGDLISASNARRVWRQALALRGQIDVLVNNAAIYETAYIDGAWGQWERSWTRTLAINLIAPAMLCREAIGHFCARDGGIIINLVSRAAFRGDSAEYMHYAASKGGLLSLTRTIARTFAHRNILAYAVAPGFVRTGLSAAYLRKYGEKAVVNEIPIGRIAEPDDVARYVAFLASGAVPHATGSTIDINGGSYIR